MLIQTNQSPQTKPQSQTVTFSTTVKQNVQSNVRLDKPASIETNSNPVQTGQRTVSNETEKPTTTANNRPATSTKPVVNQNVTAVKSAQPVNAVQSQVAKPVQPQYPVETFNVIASKEVYDGHDPIQGNQLAASPVKTIKSIYDGQPIPVDSNGRVRSECHQNTGPETAQAWKYLNHNDNLKPYQYTKLQPSDKAALDQYIKDRNAYVNELNDGKSHLSDYEKVLNEFNKLNDYGNKYPESVVPGPPCWWHGFNGWQSKQDIKNVWIASVGFISDTPDKDGHYLDVEPSFMMRHNAITGQTSFQDVIGGIYIGMPDGSSHCSNYINKSGVITVVPPKGYKFNLKESYQLEPYLTLKCKGKPMLISFTPTKAVFDFQVYADAGYQTIGTMVTPIPGHPGYYKMDNNHYFQLVVTPDGQPSKTLNLNPANKNDYQDTIDWEEDISPTLTGGFGTGDRKPGDLTRTVITLHTNGQDPKKMSNAERTFVVVAPAGWQFQNIRASKTMGPDWAQFEYNDVHDNRDSDWKRGDKLVRAPIDDGTTKTLFATPDQAHIGFFDFNRKFMGFNGQPTLGGTSHGGYDRLWLLPDQTWKGLPGQKKDQAFVEQVSQTGAKINANNLTVALGSKHDFSSVNATDWMGKPTTAKLVKGSVDLNKAGTYQLTYENINSFGIKSDKTIAVTVQAPKTNSSNQKPADNSNKPVSNNKPASNASDSSKVSQNKPESSTSKPDASDNQKPGQKSDNKPKTTDSSKSQSSQQPAKTIQGTLSNKNQGNEPSSIQSSTVSQKTNSSEKTITSHAEAGKHNSSSTTESVYDGTVNGRNNVSSQPAFTAAKTQVANRSVSGSSFSTNAEQNSTPEKNINGLLHQKPESDPSVMAQFQQQNQNATVAGKDALHVSAVKDAARGGQDTKEMFQDSQVQSASRASCSRNDQAQGNQLSVLPETGMLNDGIALVAVSLALAGMALNRKKRK